MKNYITAVVLSALLFTSCANEFNKVYKTNDYSYKYEYAKECYAQGKYTRASTLLQGLVTLQKGTDNAQESLYMLGMAEYNSKDYEGAAATFKKYFSSYPKGAYAEEAEFYAGMSLYNSTPELASTSRRRLMPLRLFRSTSTCFQMVRNAHRHSSACLSCRTSLYRRNCIRHSSTTTWGSTSATVHTEATTMRLA